MKACGPLVKMSIGFEISTLLITYLSDQNQFLLIAYVDFALSDKSQMSSPSDLLN